MDWTISVATEQVGLSYARGVAGRTDPRGRRDIAKAHRRHGHSQEPHGVWNGLEGLGEAQPVALGMRGGHAGARGAQLDGGGLDGGGLDGGGGGGGGRVGGVAHVASPCDALWMGGDEGWRHTVLGLPQLVACLDGRVVLDVEEHL